MCPGPWCRLPPLCSNVSGQMNIRSHPCVSGGGMYVYQPLCLLAGHMVLYVQGLLRNVWVQAHMIVSWEPTLAFFFQHKWAYEFRTPALFTVFLPTPLSVSMGQLLCLCLGWHFCLREELRPQMLCFSVGPMFVTAVPLSPYLCISVSLRFSPAVVRFPTPLLSPTRRLSSSPPEALSTSPLAGWVYTTVSPYISASLQEPPPSLLMSQGLFPYLSIAPLVSSCSEALSLPPSAS